MRILLVLLMLGIASSVWAADKCWPQGGGTYTLNYVNYTPDANGIDVRGYDQYLTANFLKTAGTSPTPVNEKDIAQINSQMSEGATKPKPRVSFEEGENVRVINGPFANFAGIVDEVKAEKQKVKVRVSIFGRATAVELDFAQVEKA